MTERKIYLNHIKRLREENEMLRRSLVASMVNRANDRKKFQEWRESRWSMAIDFLMFGFFHTNKGQR